MTVIGRLPELIDVFLAICLSFHFLGVCAAVSIPWLAVHLEFWGEEEGSRNYWGTASRLSEIAVYNLGLVSLSGALSYLLASVRSPETLFTASVLLAPCLGVLLAFFAVYVALTFLYRQGWKWHRRIVRLHILIALSAGVVAMFCAAFLVALVLGSIDDSLWPRLWVDPWSIFRETEFWLGWGYAFFTVFMTGGVIVMLSGREAFRWESGSSLSAGAQLIRLGAFFSLGSIFLMVVLSVVWVLFKGIDPFRYFISADRPELIPLAVIAFIGVVALVEVLMSVLKWRGSAPRASLLAAMFLFLAVFGITSLFSWQPLSSKGEDGGKAVVSTQSGPDSRNVAR